MPGLFSRCEPPQLQAAIVAAKEAGVGAARVAAAELGYACRAKHFFSNKNEITLMLARREAGARRV